MNEALADTWFYKPWLEPNRMLKLSLISAMESHPEGHILEFGVGQGGTIRTIATVAKDRPVYGFDWFNGLPEKWDRGHNVLARGSYRVDQIPSFRDLPNIRVVEGLFQDTLEPWLEQHPGTISMVHLDADLYSSTKYVLNQINDRIVPDTWLVFDELFDFNENAIKNWRTDGEWRALCEWLEEYNREIEPVYRHRYSGAAVVRK